MVLFFAGHTVPWCLDCWDHLVSMKFLSFTHWISCPETDGVFSPASALGESCLPHLLICCQFCWKVSARGSTEGWSHHGDWQANSRASSFMLGESRLLCGTDGYKIWVKMRQGGLKTSLLAAILVLVVASLDYTTFSIELVWFLLFRSLV